MVDKIITFVVYFEGVKVILGSFNFNDSTVQVFKRCMVSVLYFFFLMTVA
jgi:hypothetical protein